jgi:hypothetical protein
MFLKQKGVGFVDSCQVLFKHLLVREFFFYYFKCVWLEFTICLSFFVQILDKKKSKKKICVMICFTKDLVRVMVCREDMLGVGLFVQFFVQILDKKKSKKKMCVVLFV